MGFLKSVKKFFKPTYEPLVCKIEDVFDLIKEDLRNRSGGVPLIVEYNGVEHKIGSRADYDRFRKEDNGFFNYEFYIDETIYHSFEDFYNSAMIENEYLNKMDKITVVAHEMDGEGEYGDIRTFVLIDERYSNDN